MNDMFSAQIWPRSWLIRATVLAGSLGLIHILATPLYLDQRLGSGIVFVGIALIIALWAFTRTVGIPIGPMAGEVLPVGFLDGFAQTLGAVQILHLAVLLHQFDRLAGRPLVE